MRICLVHSEPEKLPRVQLEHRSLRRGGHDAYIMQPKVRWRFRPKALSALLRYLALLIQALCQRTDVYHILNIPDFAGFAPVLLRKKWVYDARSPWADELRALHHNTLVCWVAERIERCMTRCADIVIVVNRVLECRAREWGAKRVYIVPNYPPAEFRSTISPEDFKRQQGLSGRKIVLYVGKLSAVECTLDLVKAVSNLLGEEGIVLVMVGDGPERASIERFVDGKGITSQVRITGWIPHDEVPNWIATADICVLPRREDMPSAKFYSPHSVRKVGEYLALGRPVIATPVGEFVQTNLPIRIASLDSFSTAIKEELRNPHAVDRPSDFTWKSSERTLLKVYEDLAENAG